MVTRKPAPSSLSDTRPKCPCFPVNSGRFGHEFRIWAQIVECDYRPGMRPTLRQPEALLPFPRDLFQLPLIWVLWPRLASQAAIAAMQRGLRVLNVLNFSRRLALPISPSLCNLIPDALLVKAAAAAFQHPARREVVLHLCERLRLLAKIIPSPGRQILIDPEHLSVIALHIATDSEERKDKVQCLSRSFHGSTCRDWFWHKHGSLRDNDSARPARDA
jgi:hypothetical protein